MILKFHCVFLVHNKVFGERNLRKITFVWPTNYEKLEGKCILDIEREESSTYERKKATLSKIELTLSTCTILEELCHILFLKTTILEK